jgi:hypothetical protein
MTNDGISPQFVLAAACCRWPPSDERAAAIRAAAKAVNDWDDFLRVVKQHRVAVAVRQSLRAAGVAVPPAAAEELDALVQDNAHRGLKLAAETVRLQNCLVEADIPTIILKGVSLEQRLYGSIAAKQTRDIDVFVPPECAEKALSLLEREGYTLSSPAKRLSAMQRRALIRYAREVELINLSRSGRIELQWRVVDNPILLSGIDAHAATQTVTLSEGATVRTLAPDDLFAYLCVHGARHSWSRLKWLGDLNALLISSNANIEHLYRHAQRIGAGLCAAQRLLLCQGLLGLKLPTILTEELTTDNRCLRLVAIALEALAAPQTASDCDPGIRGIARELRYQFLLGRGFRFYLTQCRLALVGVADIVRVPLPRPLHFLYPLLRLPLWLWRRTKFALAPL